MAFHVYILCILNTNLLQITSKLIKYFQVPYKG